MASHPPENGPKTLGDFEIVGELGRGGMGVVYRAVDAKLGRQVAIKMLPESLAGDRDRQERFRREAKVLAALNHPGIAGIHSLIESSGVHFLVLELVEGRTLQDRLGDGPISVEEALDICGQIANAVEAAHGGGIIHRDLKPANVKITPDGTVKVLDFGLAKSVVDNSTSTDPALSPTVTQEGVLLGTAAYMSPEQARGKAVDKRTDVWAFGCLLYESLTGQAAYGSDSISDTLAAVLGQEPKWELIPAETPNSIVRLLRRTMAKDLSRRLRDIGDARLEIEDALAEPEPVLTPTARPHRQVHPAHYVGISVIAVGLVVAFFLYFVWGPTTNPAVSGPGDLRTTRFVERPAQSDDYLIAEPDIFLQSSLAVSVDGQHLVYVVIRDEQRQLNLRDLTNDFQAEPIPGTEGARSPFFSPDGTWVAFFTRNALKKVSLDTATVVTLCRTIPVAAGGCWLGDTIYFTPIPPSGIWSINSENSSELPWNSAGVAKEVTHVNRERGEYSHHSPTALPEVDSLLFTISSIRGWDDAQLAVLRLKDGEIQRGIRRNASSGQYDPATKELIYGHQDRLWAVPFDPQTLKTSGPPQSIASGVVTRDVSLFGVGAKTLAFIPGKSMLKRRLVWIDKEGNREPVLSNGNEGFFKNVRLSADERSILVEKVEDRHDEKIWRVELSSNRSEQFGDDNPLMDSYPLWGAGAFADTVIYNSERYAPAVPPTLVVQNLRDSSLEFPLLKVVEPLIGEFRGHAQFPTSCSPDGKHVLFTNEHNETGYDIWAMPATEPQECYPLFDSRWDESAAVFSPDGKWIAYQSDRGGGRNRVYLAAWSNQGRVIGRPIPISNAEGVEPLWGRDAGDLSLFYRRGGQVMVVKSSTEDSFTPGNPKPAFPIQVSDRRIFTRRIAATYDVTRDGRFLMIEEAPDERTTEIHVVTNRTGQIDQASTK